MNDSISQKEKEYWIVLSATPGIGPTIFSRLIKHFGSAKIAWQASAKELKSQKVSNKVIGLITRRRKLINPSSYYLQLVKNGYQSVSLLDKQYPQRLKSIKKAPPVLYFKGSLQQADSKSIAVVGSRKPSSYGVEVTKKLVTDLVNQGFTIISGLARGIDGVAHRTVLENNGRTIGFLGGGIDSVYPAEHRGLAQKMLQKGAIISEFPPGLPPSKGNFPARNRLISGMSMGVLIIQGLSKSGTKHTANHASSQGRPILAVPGPITSSLSDAPMDLLDDGATMVRSIEDILVALKVEKKDSKIINKDIKKFDSLEEELIYILIKREPMENNQLIQESGLDTTTVLTTLSMMEVKGIIKNLFGQYHTV